MLNPSTRKYVIGVALFALLLIVATACAPAAPTAAPAATSAPVIQTSPPVIQTSPPVVQTVIVQGTPQTVVVTPTAAPVTGKLFFDFGAGDVPTADPALATDTSSSQVVYETTVGLAHLNEATGALEKGLASDWKQSSDGLTWTFTIDKSLGVKWVKYNTQSGKVEVVKDDKGNDRLVTAHDFEYGVKRLLDPRTASDYASVVAAFIKGADKFNGADPKKTADADMTKLRDALGIKATDDWTLQVTTVEPTGFFPEIMALAVTSAEPQWLIEDKGDRWTEAGFFQGYGPFLIKEWVHEDHLTLIANPLWPGIASVPKSKINEVTGYMLDTGPSLANYETGKQDFSQVPLSDIDRVKADPKLSKEFSTSPQQCTYYVGFNSKKPPFDNPKVRLAFSEAIDRQSLVDNVTKGGQLPAQWMSRPGLPGSPDPKTSPDLGVKYDPADAKKLLTDAGFSDPSKLGPITYMYNTNEGHKKIAEAFQQMWQKNLGVTVNVVSQEWKVFLKTRQTDAPQIFREGWCIDYPDADTFHRELFDSKVGQAHPEINWTNPQYDQLVEQAARETDPAKRVQLYSQAENILVKQDAAVAPIYWYTTVWLTKPYVKRTFGVLGYETFEKWEIQPH
jgi:oligopeptide transport system substrate-binding protein